MLKPDAYRSLSVLMRHLRMTAACVTVCAATLYLSGCAGPQCRITVSNASPNTIASVTVSASGASDHTFSTIKPRETARYQTLEYDLSGRVALHITDTNGVTHTSLIQLPSTVPSTFKGRVVFQIEADGRARPFILPHPDDQGHDLPWAEQPAWEAAPNIPGLSAED